MDFHSIISGKCGDYPDHFLGMYLWRLAIPQFPLSSHINYICSVYIHLVMCAGMCPICNGWVNFQMLKFSPFPWLKLYGLFFENGMQFWLHLRYSIINSSSLSKIAYSVIKALLHLRALKTKTHDSEPYYIYIYIWVEITKLYYKNKWFEKSVKKNNPRGQIRVRGEIMQLTIEYFSRNTVFIRCSITFRSPKKMHVS